MLVRMYTDNPSSKELDRVVKLLERDGVIIYPTDSVYAFGCSVRSVKAIEKLRKIRGKGLSSLTLVCGDISQISEYCRVGNATFKTLKRNLPGAFTFILPAFSCVPEKALEKRKTIGVRVPANFIARAIIERLNLPLISISVKDDDDAIEYTTDPELIYERYGDVVDLVIDGGYGDVVPTTIVDLTEDQEVILREGRAVLK